MDDFTYNSLIVFSFFIFITFKSIGRLTCMLYLGAYYMDASYPAKRVKNCIIIMKANE